MSTAQLVVQHLPYLRRYARALTGSQMAGRRLCAATLETLVSEPETIGAAGTSKSTLPGVHADLELPVGERPERADPARSAGGGPHRPDHAAAAAGVPALLPRRLLRGGSGARSSTWTSTAVRELVDEAGRELAADMATDILIIEDEPLIAMDLEALVEGLGHNVIGVARTRTEAVKLAAEQAPGPDPRGHPARRRQFGPRRGQRPPQGLRGPGDLHHRLSASASSPASGRSRPSSSPSPSSRPMFRR